MLARAERLQRQFFHIAEAGDRRASWAPPADVVETRREVVVLVGMPGVDPASVQTTIENGTLIVRGERILPLDLGRIFIHRLELPTGPFERKILLPKGRYGNAAYATSHGCLVVTLNKNL